RGSGVLDASERGEAHRHRRGDEGDHRRRAGARRRRLHPRLSRGEVHAGGEDHADLRGHQPDSASRHRADTDDVVAGSGGLLKVIRVPRPVSESMRIDPPIESNRANSEPRPMWPLATARLTSPGSKPVPLSRTVRTIWSPTRCSPTFTVVACACFPMFVMSS